MESILDFMQANVWYSEQQKAWMFINKPFRRKGQAEKAGRQEFQRRRRLGLPRQVLAKRVM